MYNWKLEVKVVMKENKKYEEVFAELEALVGRIEDPERDLSAIGADVKKAMDLIAWCRDDSRGSQEEIEKLLIKE